MDNYSKRTLWKQVWRPRQNRPTEAVEQPMEHVRPEANNIHQNQGQPMEHVRPEVTNIHQNRAALPMERVRPEATNIHQNRAAQPMEHFRPEATNIHQNRAVQPMEHVRPEATNTHENRAAQPMEHVRPEATNINENHAAQPMEHVRPEATNTHQELPPRNAPSYLHALVPQQADRRSGVERTAQNPQANMISLPQPGRREGKSILEPSKDPVVNTAPAREKQILSMDCEMVAVRYPGLSTNVPKAAYVCVVDSKGRIAYRSFIAQQHPIADCLTWISGITRRDLKNAPSLQSVQMDLYRLFRGNILVGHALDGDLNSLDMLHPSADQRDTQIFFERNLLFGETRTNLKLMAAIHLGREIQRPNAAHDPVEDARATMDLYLLYEDQMDAQAQASTSYP